MPDYRAPGVYLDETRPPPRIEGVATDIAGFAGAAAQLPAAGDAVPLVTSIGQFTSLFGDGGEPLAEAARAFFANGGRRLRVAAFARPTGRAMVADDFQTALDRLQDCEDVALIAAPGAATSDEESAAAVAGALVARAEAAGSYRFALLDPPPGLDRDGIRRFRSRFDSSRAALYYPWITVTAGVQAPSGFVAGICARVDSQRGVHKAPANEIVVGAIGLEREIGQREQDVLNPLGIDCIRRLAGRGIVVWGARTMSSDPEWKYVSVRRTLLYLQASIERGTQWALFEPNGSGLWARLRSTIEDFLTTTWRDGALVGIRPEQAFFVRCDATTMSQADLDAGRLVCEIGVAPVRPAEFVIFRIGQWTASARSPP